MNYIYLGDKLTDPYWRGLPVNAVRRQDGKCITGRGSMLVEDVHGTRCVVLRRLLVKRKVTA